MPKLNRENCACCTYFEERAKNGPLSPGDGNQTKKKEKVRRHSGDTSPECRRFFFPKKRRGRTGSPHFRRAGSLGKGNGGVGRPGEKVPQKITVCAERRSGDMPGKRGASEPLRRGIFGDKAQILGKNPPKSRNSSSKCTIQRAQNKHNSQIVGKDTNNS